MQDEPDGNGFNLIVDGRVQLNLNPALA